MRPPVLEIASPGRGRQTHARRQPALRVLGAARGRSHASPRPGRPDPRGRRARAGRGARSAAARPRIRRAPEERVRGRARAAGYTEIVAVPGDVPGVSAAHLNAAFRALETRDIVLGPSPDGGVWLIGSRAGTDLSDLFERVPWRTAGVFSGLVRNAPGAALLDALLDVDRPSDLAVLASEPGLDPALAALLRSLRPAPVFPTRIRLARTHGSRPVAPARAPPAPPAA